MMSDHDDSSPSGNVRLRAAREAMKSPSGAPGCMTRRELADVANSYLWNHSGLRENLTEHDIGRYERGEVRWPRARRRQALHGALGTSTDTELGFYPNRGSRRRPASLKRKNVGNAVSLPNGEVDDLPNGDSGCTLISKSFVPGPEVIEHFSQLRALLVDSDNRLGAACVLPTVQRQIELISRLRRQSRAKMHEQLLSTEARWLEFSGWLHDDLGERAAGTVLLSQATSMALEAGDSDMSAYLFARSAQRSILGADDDRVLGLARAAIGVGTSHRHVRAFSVLQQAHGYAGVGEAYMFEAAIAQALALVEAGPAEHGDLGSFCTVPYVLAQEGEGWLRLNRPRKAVERFSQALEIWPTGFQRDRGVYLTRTAAAQLESQQPELAATIAKEALRVARSTQSRRIEKELETLGYRFAKFADNPAVASLLAELEASKDGL